MGSAEKVVEASLEFFGSWRFAAFALSLILFFDLLISSVLLASWSDNAAASFVEAFKIWCFGYDPESKSLSYSSVVTFYLVSVMLASIILSVWGGALSFVWKSGPRALIPWTGSALVLVALSGIAFAVMYEAPPPGLRPFPAAALRTSYDAPFFELTSPSGRTISLGQLKGRVVLITAVYATCGDTCPLILAQIDRATASLTDEERSGVTILALTLDPEHDTPDVLGQLAEVYGVKEPFFNLLSGDPAAVNSALDRLGFARFHDRDRKRISHVNLFLIVDRQGKLAYRFTLGDEQEAWMKQGLRLLINEKL